MLVRLVRLGCWFAGCLRLGRCLLVYLRVCPAPLRGLLNDSNSHISFIPISAEDGGLCAISLPNLLYTITCDIMGILDVELHLMLSNPCKEGQPPHTARPLATRHSPRKRHTQADLALAHTSLTLTNHQTSA
jgi:hypothetical protein